MRRTSSSSSPRVLYETNLFPELEHTFKHALTHEVAYGTLLGDRRRALHARIVEAIERLYADRLSEQAEQLAHHAVKGEVWDQAVTFCMKRGPSRSSDRATSRPSRTSHRASSSRGDCRRAPTRCAGVAAAPGARPRDPDNPGFGSPEVERTYLRARDLCARLGEPPIELFQALWGLWLFTGAGRGGFKIARPIAEELLAVAERLDDRVLRLERTMRCHRPCYISRAGGGADTWGAGDGAL